jgi:phosphoribosylamine--glycine ligase
VKTKKTGNKSNKFLVVSKWGDSLDIAYQLTKEGNEVRMYIQDKASREVGYGFVKKQITGKNISIGLMSLYLIIQAMEK